MLLFFVHTSLVLMFSLDRLEKSGKRLLWFRFMLRRVFRIYPLSVLACIVYIVGKFPHSIRHGEAVGPISALQAVANFGLFQNLVRIESIPGVLWSLPFEIQMYAALPFLFYIAKYRKEWMPWVLVLGGLLAGIIGGAFLFVPCFLAGVIAFTRPASHRFPAWLWPLFILSLVAFYSALTVYFEPLAWGICLLLGLSIPYFRESTNWLVNMAAAAIARYSFGIYLFHLIPLWLCFDVLRLGLLSIPAAFALTFILSRALFYLVEQPLMNRGSALARRFEQPTEAEGSIRTSFLNVTKLFS